MKQGKDLYIFAGVIVIILAFSVILAGNIYYFRDFSAYIFPLKYFLKASVLNCDFPFLNSRSNMDVPFFANPQAGVLYPLSIIFYILPMIPGLKIYIILHFIIAYLAMYYFMRRVFHMREMVALYAGIMLALSGFLLSLVEYLSILSTLVWFPLALTCVKKAVDSDEWKYWILTGLIFSLMFLGGKPDHAALCMGVSFLFAIYMSFDGSRRYLKVTAGFLFSAMVFLLLCMAQILPFIEFILSSDRGMGTFEVVAKGSIHPLETIKFIIPDIFGNYTRDVRHFWFGQIYFLSFYIGIAPLLLALFSLYGKGRYIKAARFFAVVFFVSLLLSFGRFTPLYSILYKYFIPIRFMQYPSKFMYFAIFSLVVLSSIGFNNYLTLFREKNYGIIKPHVTKLVLASSVFLCALLLLLIFQRCIKGLLAHAFTFFSAEFIDFEYGYLLRRFFQLCAVFLLLAMPVKVLLRKQASASRFALFITVFSVINIFFYNFNMNPVQGDDFFSQKPRITEYLDLKEGGRALFVDDKEKSIFQFRNYNPEYPVWDAYHKIHKELMHPNMNIMYGVSSPDSMWVVEPVPNMDDSLNIENINMMSLLSVKYIYTVREIAGKAYELTRKLSYDEFLYPVNVYQNRKALPEVFFTSRFRTISDEGAALDAIRSSGFDPGSEIILKDHPEEKFLRGDQNNTISFNISSSRLSSNKTEVDIETGGNGLLFISRRYGRNWKCFVNGKLASLYRANVFFQAVPLRKGRNIVRLSYIPDTFIYGSIVSVVSLVFLAVFYLSKVRRR